MSKLLVKDKERNLLLNSASTKEFPLLENYIANNCRYTEDDIADKPDLQDFFKNIYGQILKTATDEWKEHPTKKVEVIENPNEDVRSCELCGQKHLKYVCYITNPSTNSELQVGSECIQKFDMSFKKSILEQKKDLVKLVRKNQLNTKYPGLESTLLNWNMLLTSIPIILSKTLEDKYYQIGKDIKQLFNDYINGDTKDCIEKISELLTNSELVKREIQQYIETNRDNIYIPTRIDKQYLQSINDTTGLIFLDEDRCISERVFIRIAHESFLSRFRNLIDSSLINTGFQITSISDEGYMLKHSSNSSIIFVAKHRELSLKLVKNIYNSSSEKNKIIVDDIISKIKIYDENSYHEVFDYILRQINSSIAIYQADNYETNEIYFYEPKSSDEIITLNYKELVERFKIIAISRLNYGDLISEYIINSINKRTNRKFIGSLSQ